MLDGSNPIFKLLILYGLSCTILYGIIIMIKEAIRDFTKSKWIGKIFCGIGICLIGSLVLLIMFALIERTIYFSYWKLG